MPDHVLDFFSKPTAEWFRHTFGEPTEVQKKAWPAIAGGNPVLVSAPTGTGKTLSAFLIFIDRLMQQAREKTLKEGVQLIYISPLKSLASDIRENLKKPLEGIASWEEKCGGKTGEGKPAEKSGTAAGEIAVAIRTGDTLQKERQRMVKHPPHILITTPESLYLMLTSRSGQSVLKTAQAIVIDELHALIDTKRGAHLLFCVARLEWLCGRRLQRIGLSATIEPLRLAADWLSPESAVIVAPVMKKKVEITVVGTTPAEGRKKDPVWEELARKVYERCHGKRSVIAFSEGRRYAEKLAYYVNQIAEADSTGAPGNNCAPGGTFAPGSTFARVHHGSLSKDQRFEVEEALRDGRIRLLCATSSMELGIDVGEIDEVLQIGCPRTVSSTMQRLGRAGHNPGRVSVMYMYPRTAPEGLYCGMTAALACQGGVEEARPPRQCLDVLAQHLVSMGAGGLMGAGTAMRCLKEEKGAEAAAQCLQDGKGTKEERSSAEIAAAAYSVDDVLALAARAWPFAGVTKETVEHVLRMLAGDYEHNRELPVRPRVTYDRIHGVVYPDPYSRMLAVAAGGTIPDKGLYAAKTLDGVKLGELDEEFVYESYVGDRFLLGSFGWRMVGQDKDTVYVEPAPADSARVPFWKGEIRGRSLKTSLAFGRMLAEFGRTQERNELQKKLEKLGLDQPAAQNAADFLHRQIAATGCLPDDKTVIAEHFCDHTGSHQVMIHSLFGRRINAPLSILMQYVLREKWGMNAGCVDEEDGILLYPYGEEKIPEKILYSIDPDAVHSVLEAALVQTPLFGMTFRYNAARALMMGMKRNGRQPLWMQRLRSTEMLDSLVGIREHPLMAETRRECLEELWDIEGVLWLLSGIRSGLIAVREVYVDVPSPMSLPLQWQVEAAEMYEYSPVTPGIRQAAYEELKHINGLKPSTQELEKVQERKKLPRDAEELHTLLVMEGDLEAGELETPVEWLEELALKGRALYIEPGLWIAAEQKEEYEAAFAWLEQQSSGSEEAERQMSHILRRMLCYRGPMTGVQIALRYFGEEGRICSLLQKLCEAEEVVEDAGIYYHARLYRRAQKATIRSLRSEAAACPPKRYAALIAAQVNIAASAAEQVKETIRQYCGYPLAASLWEEVLLARRVKGYREALLDGLLAEGDYFWRFLPDGRLCFEKTDDVAWDSAETDCKGLFLKEKLDDSEQILYGQLERRGAAFLKQLSRCLEGTNAQDVLLSLAQKGLVCADSFVPVRPVAEPG